MTANAKRSLKAIETLARVKDAELSELKRTANIAADRLQRANQAIQALQADLVTEGKGVGEALEMRMAYTRYALGSKGRRRALERLVPGLEQDIALADAALLEGFRGLKRLEEAAKSHRTQIAATFERKSRVEADDLAAIRAVRRARA